ncbi:TlpA disulfide reductase family protein [Streptomyces sp. NPDC048290]|uniref:TlpA family protein disulfide reductase n=1 Tax=Streptomyces sp. NPDC048290 TaxID=3155811 RepID=UPI00342DA89F
MPYLTAAVLLLALLGVFNLALTLGLVRRIRERPAAPAGDQWDRVSGLAAGAPVGAFSALDVDGRPVTHESLSDGLMVVFVSPDCPACEETLPHVVERAREYGRDQVLAVVVRDGDEPGDPAPYVERLAPVARVAVADMGGDLTTAFALQGLPAYAELGADGRVADTGRILPRRPAREHDRAGAGA